MDSTDELRQTIKRTLAVFDEIETSQQLRMDLSKLLQVLEHRPLQPHLAAAELQYRIIDYLIGRPRSSIASIAEELGESPKCINGALSALKRQKRITTHEVMVCQRGVAVKRQQVSAT